MALGSFGGATTHGCPFFINTGLHSRFGFNQKDFQIDMFPTDIAQHFGSNDPSSWAFVFRLL